VGLRRSVASGGHEKIDHALGSHNHDDVANCVAGAAAPRTTGTYDGSLSWVDGPSPRKRTEAQSPTVSVIAALSAHMVR